MQVVRKYNENSWEYPMQILAHRGLWLTLEEQNTYSSITEAMQLGYGVELDVRDYLGEIVVSHDIVKDSNPLFFKEILSFYKNLNHKPLLAINLKTDGIRDILKSLIEEYRIDNYFIFDGSFPEAYKYITAGLKVFTRESEYETPSSHLSTVGIWLDSFNSNWFSQEVILNHLLNGTKVAIVSPELHSRNYQEVWSMIEKIDPTLRENIILCTDYPTLAAKYFKLPYIKAVIFDMDGVLIEAKEWHYESLNMALAVFNEKISVQEHQTTLDGLPTKTKLQYLANQGRILQQDFKEIENLKQQYFMEVAKASCIPFLQHINMLSRLKEFNFNLVVCSNSIRPTVDLLLELASIKDYFNFTLSNQDVSKPKPDPEIYNIAISRLGLTPSECLIVEDNFNGIQAAQQSGANVFIISVPKDLDYRSVLGKIQTTRSSL